LKVILEKLWVLDEAMDIDRFKFQKLVKEGKVAFDKVKWCVVKSTTLSFRGSEKKE
jgi:hypothetical protein